MPDNTEVKAVENDTKTVISEEHITILNEVHELLKEAASKLGGDLALAKTWLVDKVRTL